jgi:hypothetical protein
MRVSARGLMTLPTAVRGRHGQCLTRFAGDMPYLVELTDRATSDLVVLYVEKNANESIAAARSTDLSER